MRYFFKSIWLAKIKIIIIQHYEVVGKCKYLHTFLKGV